MTRLRLFVLIALAACWLPATSHCALEAAQIVTSGCCSTGDSSSDDGCDRDIGCAWESATTISNAQQLALKAPLVACLCSVCTLAVVVPEEIGPEPTSTDTVTPSWISYWNFERRTALPVRAPAAA